MSLSFVIRIREEYIRVVTFEDEIIFLQASFEQQCFRL